MPRPYLGGQRIAMRVQDPNATDTDATYYILGDHLGSTSVVADETGGYSSELRYTPWGESRLAFGALPTDYMFTGQKDSDFGLMFYNARWYDVSLGRFTQADTILPDPGNPQAFDRYAYVLNNPVKYTDPTGHYYYDPGCDCMVATGNPGNEDPDNLTYENTANANSVLIDVLFDPFKGAWAEDYEDIGDEGLENVFEVWNAAEEAYKLYGIDLESIAMTPDPNNPGDYYPSANPLTIEQVGDFYYGEAAHQQPLIRTANHAPYLVFMNLLADKYGEHLRPSGIDKIMQTEPNYMAALMEAYPEVLEEAWVVYAAQNQTPDYLQAVADDIIDFRPFGGGE